MPSRARRNGQSVVVVGTDFARARQLNHWWKVSHWPDAPNEALVGMRAATVVSPKGSPNRQPFELTFQGKPIELAPAGMLQTGAGEDSRIYLDQSEFQKLDRGRALHHRSRRQWNRRGY